MTAVAVLPDGRVITGGYGVFGVGGGRVLVWDPARAGHRPGRARPPGDVVDPGRGASRRRVVTGKRSAAAGGCWCGTRRKPGTGPVELGRSEGTVTAVAVLPDGRVITGGIKKGGGGGGGGKKRGGGAVSKKKKRLIVFGRGGGRVLVWDPAQPGTGPVELGRGQDAVTAVAVLPDCRVITGGGGRVLVWDPASRGTGPVESAAVRTR